MTRQITAVEWWRLLVAHAELTDAYGTAGVNLPNPAQIDWPSLATVFDDVPPARTVPVQPALPGMPADPAPAAPCAFEPPAEVTVPDIPPVPPEGVMP